MIRVVCIFGTRPEAIKMAPVVRELRKQPDRFRIHTCATAQHREMLDQVLDLFGIVPDADLDLMQEGQTLSQVASRVLTRLEPVLREERPDWVLVQGDTTTVMATAIAAHHLRIRVGHVEAGLRTGATCALRPRSAPGRISSRRVSRPGAYESPVTPSLMPSTGSPNNRRRLKWPNYCTNQALEGCGNRGRLTLLSLLLPRPPALLRLCSL
jgi:hypothetical protein